MSSDKMDNHDRMRRLSDEEFVRRAFESAKATMDVTPSPGHEEALLERMLAAYDAQSKRSTPRREAPILRLWFYRVAAAAAAILLVGGATWWILGNVGRASADLNDMLKRVSSAMTASYDVTFKVPGKTDLGMHIQMAAGGRVRWTTSDGKVHIIDRQQELMYSPKSKRALLRPLEADYDDALVRLRQIHSVSGQLVRNEQEAGRKLQVYRVTQSHDTTTIWVDAKTQYPVRMEVVPRQSGQGNEKVVLDNFRWNEPLAESTFAFNVPAGYQLVRAGTEADWIAAIQLCARLSQSHAGGKLPAQLHPASFDLLVVADQKKRDPSKSSLSAGNFALSQLDEQAKESIRLGQRAFLFAQQVKSAGGTLRYCEADCSGPSSVLCYWQMPGETTFRVMLGDLQVRTLTSTQLQSMMTDTPRHR